MASNHATEKLNEIRNQLLGFISPSQFWSLLMIVGGVVVYFYHRKLLQKAVVEAEKAQKELPEEIPSEQAEGAE